MLNPLLDIANLRVRYRCDGRTVVALDRAALRIAPGEIVGLTGRSGAGKSTLAAALIGLLDRSAEVSYDRFSWRGIPVATPRELRGRAIGYIAQDAAAALNPFVRCGVQVAEALCGVSGRRARRDRVYQLLRGAGLSDPARILTSYPHQLSGGECQRVVIAIAAANAPALLIADEPTSALDGVNRQQFIADIERRRRELDSALLLISHDYRLLAKLAGRVVRLEGGRIVDDPRWSQAHVA